MKNENQSKLNKLIQDLCPEGVEYRTLGEVCSLITDGSHYSPTAISDGYYMPSVKDMRASGFDFSNCKQISEKDYLDLVKNGCRPEIGDLLVAKDGSMLKYAFTVKEKLEVVVLSSIAILRPIPNLISGDFLSHYLTRESFKESVIRDYSTTGGVPRIILKNFKKIPIPVPPLPVQAEIVRILDAFTALTAELTAELTARRKQYEYYRDRLLKFDGREEGVEWRKIKDITRVFSAARVLKNEWRESGVPFLRSSDVIAAYRNEANSRGKAYISEQLYEKLSSQTGRFEKDDILVTGGGTIGIPFIVQSDEPLYAKDADLICIKRCQSFISGFIYHYFATTRFRDYLNNITHNSTIAHYTISQVEETPIPLPPLTEQRRIVSILDRFDALCNDLSSGLPAEIEARRKQYEYYRDRLLTFDRAE